jgi:hypothetical protein
MDPMKIKIRAASATLAFAACVGPCAAQATAPADTGLRQCRAVADAQARLACYDAMPLSGPAPAAAPAAATAASTAAAKPAAIATATAAATAATAPAPSPAPAAAPALIGAVAVAPAVAPTTGPSPQAERFGLDTGKEVLQSISSSLPGPFAGWGPRTRFVLANGQVWQVADGSSAVYGLHNPKVVVRKAFMSGFELEIEGVNQVPRVRRVP